MSKIISMPSNKAYRDSWDRIFGKDTQERADEASERKPAKTSCGSRCGCGKKAGKAKV